VNYAFHLSTPLILCAIAIDAIAGDPVWLPHPVRLIGGLIAAGESWLWSGDARRDRRNGIILTAIVVLTPASVAWALISAGSVAGNFFGAFGAVIIAWTTIALRGLDRAAEAVEHALATDDLNGARHAIRALVGRDPEALDYNGLIRAAVESVAENCSDGVIAPMLYLFAGGPVAAMGYKAINTLDSMIGYLDDHYRWFGRSAARLDDLANLLPARISALCLIAAAKIVSQRSAQAYAACVTSASMHPSPNAGYPESVMAGALGIQLGGEAIYGGEIEEHARLGIAEREPRVADIAKARALMQIATAVAFCMFALVRCAILRVVS
jgi:adenosylcobinamide-phosphate synthase